MARVIFALALLFAAAPAMAAVPSLVAAENMYGDIARQLAGDHAAVRSILSNPDQDPHLFEADVTVGKALAGAQIVVLNGAGYDPWMHGLIDAAGKIPGRQVIDVASLIGAHDGDNPHLWYRLDAVRALARAVSAALAKADPADRAEFASRLAAFDASLNPIAAKIAALKARYAGVPVTATEPVFGYMASAIGLVMRNETFQWAVMNNAEPSVSQTQAMEDDLRQHKVRLLIYNRQATDTAAKRLLGIADQAGVKVIGVTETEPAGQDYQHWMLGQLDALGMALQSAR